MPKPPAQGQVFLVTIAIPGPITTEAQKKQFDAFKAECNTLADKYGARVTEVRLEPKP